MSNTSKAVEERELVHKDSSEAVEEDIDFLKEVAHSKLLAEQVAKLEERASGVKDRFDFEQEIMQCWSVVEDIDIACRTLLDAPDNTEDTVANMLLGMSCLYQAKFEQMFSTFEHLVRERNL